MKKLVAVAALIAAAAALVAVRLHATRHRSERIERSGLVALPPDAVLAELGDLRNWAAWSPWERGPVRSRVYGGPTSAAGASCYWSAARGEAGRLTIVAVRGDGLDVELERRGSPPADLELRLRAAPGGTQLTWVYVVEPDLFARALAFLGLEDPAAALLEQGLDRLAAVVAARPRVETYRAERAVWLRAAPAAVLARLRDVRSFSSWSPWDEPGRLVERSFGGPRDGAGASAYWSEEGSTAVAGRLTVTRASAAGVELELELGGASSDHVLAVAPEAGGTRVTWTTTGEVGPGAAPDPEALGVALERGLLRLKALVEDGAVVRYAGEVRP